MVSDDPFEGHEAYILSREEDRKASEAKALQFKKSASSHSLTTKQILLIAGSMVMIFVSALSITKIIVS